ncbi:MAG: 1-(5-phosphoribosyl)-5-[(5-phosphoribosylamino)methylideneamino]imidazole-4-carboxamide isomerase [Candidatus Omnitrophica bacterium]|nr:1-(5-phosphoribosyl)-5-[(5-phosphoribosylamino)methylideneamino]imidazole-4-carboxamide isomerase [Candidatus Omnitrophota bacterium]
MQIIPAIDLKDGKVVRLTRGDYQQVKVYSDDPVRIAKNWQDQGASTLHIVDLDGALAGKPKNSGSVAKIVKAVGIPVELGGGLRSEKDISGAFKSGASKVVLGSKAVEEVDVVKDAINKYGEKIIVSIDSRDGLVMLQGWTKASTVKAIDLAKKVEGLGAFAVIYTDITVDGTLSGPNLDGLDDFLSKVNISVISAGGISSLDDIKRLKALDRKNLYGVIVGKALYEGALDLKEAISICLQKE